MFKVMNRLFFKELLLSILLVLLAFLILFITIDALSEASLVGQADYNVGTMIKVAALNQIEYAYQLLPICTLIGSVLTLSNMAARSELVVWRVSGMSLWHLVRVVVSVGLLLSLVVWLIGDMGITQASQEARQTKKQALHKKGYFKTEGGFWGKQNLPDGSFRMINIESLKDKDTLVRVYLYDLSPQFALTRLLEAQTARPLNQAGLWQLKDVRQLVLNNDSQGQVLARKESRLPSMDVDLAENNINVIRNYGQDTINMSLLELKERIQTLSNTGQDFRAFEVAYWQKVIYPFSVVVMILLALPFAFMQTRKGGVSVRVFTGIMLGLVFFVLTAITQYLGPLVSWSPIVLAVAPSLFFLTIAVIWTHRVSRV